MKPRCVKYYETLSQCSQSLRRRAQCQAGCKTDRTGALRIVADTGPANSWRQGWTLYSLVSPGPTPRSPGASGLGPRPVRSAGRWPAAGRQPRACQRRRGGDENAILTCRISRTGAQAAPKLTGLGRRPPRAPRRRDHHGGSTCRDEPGPHRPSGCAVGGTRWTTLCIGARRDPLAA